MHQSHGWEFFLLNVPAGVLVPRSLLKPKHKGVVFRMLVYTTGKSLLLFAGCHLFKLGARLFVWKLLI